MVHATMRTRIAILAVGCCLTVYSSARPMHKQQQQQPLQVSFAELTPTVASIWVPSITTSAKTLQVPVSGLPGTPLPVDEMSRLVYTVTYNRKPAYVLQGTVTVTPTGAFSSTDQQPVQQPLVTLRQNSQAATIPNSKVKCNNLMVSQLSSVSCTFSTTIFALDAPPPAGTAQALIQIPGTGTHIQTPPMTYDFSRFAPSNLRISSDSQMSNLLFNSLERPPATTAVVTNYFERGNDIILPTGVAGAQPPPESILSNTTTYTYTALFGDVPRDRCGKKWKVMATASVESTSDGLQSPDVATSIVDLELLGCGWQAPTPAPAPEMHDCDEAGGTAAAAAGRKHNATATKAAAAAGRNNKPKAAAAAAAAVPTGSSKPNKARSNVTTVSVSSQHKGNQRPKYNASSTAAVAAAGKTGSRSGSNTGTTSHRNKSARVRSAFVRPLATQRAKPQARQRTTADGAAKSEAAAVFRVQLTVKGPAAVAPTAAAVKAGPGRQAAAAATAAARRHAGGKQVAAKAGHKSPAAAAAVTGHKPRVTANQHTQQHERDLALPKVNTTATHRTAAQQQQQQHSGPSSRSSIKESAPANVAVSTAARPQHKQQQGELVIEERLQEAGHASAVGVATVTTTTSQDQQQQQQQQQHKKAVTKPGKQLSKQESGPAKAGLHKAEGKAGSGSSSKGKKAVKEDGLPSYVTTMAAPANVFMAAQGSTLCGRFVCTPGQICLDDIVCCDPGSATCGGSCCPRGNLCMNGRCMPPGSSTCGTTTCSPQQSCLSGKCCDANTPTCGNTCCDAGQMCVNSQCVVSGSSACGTKVCGPDQQCAAPGVCCGAGETQCGASCCGAGNTCLNGQCVAGGSSVCAGQICGPGTVCTDGAVCCPAGSSFCGGQCCGSGNQCVNGRCLPWGSSACGGNVCNVDQTCQNGVCCNRGETGCGTGCCATSAGMQCIRNQCLPMGTQPCGTTMCPPGTHCGDPYRSLCCAQNTRSCAGSCCPADHVCSWRQQCVPWNSVEAGSHQGAHVDYIGGLENPDHGHGYGGYNGYNGYSSPYGRY